MDLSCYNSSDISLSSLSGEENEKSTSLRDNSRSRSRSKSTHKHKKKHKEHKEHKEHKRHSHKHKHKHKSSSRKEKKHKKRSKHKSSKDESNSESSASEVDLELVDQLLESGLDHGKVKENPKETKEKSGGRDIEIRHSGAGNGAVASMKISVSNTLSDISNANGKKTEFNTLVVDSSSEEEQMDSTENSREARESIKKYDELSMDSSEFLNIDEDNVGLEELIKQKAALQACLGAYMSDEDNDDEEDDSEDDSDEDDDEDEDEGEEDEEKEIDEDDDIVEMKRVTSSRSKVDRRRQEAGAADKRKNGTTVTDVVTIEDSDEDDIKKKDKDKERRKEREKAKKRKRSRYCNFAILLVEGIFC